MRCELGLRVLFLLRFQDLLHRRQQVRYLDLDHIPKYLEVEGKIDMGEEIPHTGYSAPVGGWMPLAKVGRRVLDSLADYFEITNGGIEGLFVTQEIIKGITSTKEMTFRQLFSMSSRKRK